MALQTKTFDGSTNHSYWDFRIVVTENSTSTSGNTSSITVNPQIGRIGSSSYMTGAEINCTLRVSGCNPQYINGTYTTGTIAAGSWYSLGSKTFTVEHGADGNRTVEVSASFTNDVNPGSGSASGSMILTYIPRAATMITAPNFTDEDNPTIEFSNPAGDVAEIQVCITDEEGNEQYVKYRTIPSTDTTYTFELTDEERTTLINAIPDGTDWTYVKFYVRTVIDDKTVDTPKGLTRKFTVVNADPEISTVIKDIGEYSVNTLTKDETVMIKGFNHMHATMAVTTKKGATIKSQSIQNGDTIINDSAAEFPSAENGLFIFTVTDSFGHTVSKEVEVEVIEYVTLTCNLVANKPTADGNMALKISGNYFDDKFGLKGVSNTLVVKWRIKENNGSYGNWNIVSSTKTGSAYTASVNITGLNYQSTYTVQATATDMINTSGILSVERIVKTTPVFNWGENNFDINVPLDVKGSISIDGALLPDLMYPVGSIYTTSESISPETLFGGTWTKIRTFYGGELVAFASVRASGSSSTSIADGTEVGFGDSRVGEKSHDITNYIDGVFTIGNGAIKVQTKGIVGMVEASMTISGLGGANIVGIWYGGNNNALPDNIKMLPGSGNVGLMTGPYGNKYGGSTHNYIYRVATTDDTTFYVNPKFKPYGGILQPSISGAVSSLLVKAYAKYGVTHMWQRVS